MSELIHWHEGLFLQPHHLQNLQTGIHETIRHERRIALPFHYGVLSASLAKDDLEDHRIRFDSLTAAFPSGIIMDFPKDAELPSLDIRKPFRERPEGFMVYLALPLWLEGRPNTVDLGANSAGQKLIFSVTEHEVADENSGRNRQPVQFRHLNARLVIEGEDMSDMEYLPILRVKREVVEDTAGFPRPDPEYVPPTILLCGSAIIFQLVRDLTSQVCATRDQLAHQLSNTPMDLRLLQGAQFEYLCRLRAVHRGGSVLTSVLDESTLITGCAGRVSLFSIYGILKELLAELASLYPAKGLPEPLPYDHEDPYPPFRDLDRKIRAYLGGVTGPMFRKIDFKLMDDNFFGDLQPEFFKGATGFYLSVEAPLDASSLTRLVENPDDFKLEPEGYLRRALYGIKLKEERNPPPELPYTGRRCFYRVLENGKVWDDFRKDQRGAVHFEDDEINKYDKKTFKIALYATLPNAI